MKSTVLRTYTSYPSRKIRRIRTLNFTQHPRGEDLYAISRLSHTPYSSTSHEIFWIIIIMEPTPRNPNTPYDKDVHFLRSVETKFPAIVYNDALTSELELLCEPTIFNVDDLKLDMGNGDDKIDIKQSSGDLSIELLPNVINIDVGAYAQGSNKLLETYIK
ncbi:hypothetical protein Tco_0906481 [Tanacetum coccineum]|uniref:Uncharacterized protein n=1 Tax=Tanacetum coccineum TaxID=301880 RepID=A0ABQ5CJZ1_9ASTR